MFTWGILSAHTISLLTSFNLTRIQSRATHIAGEELDLISRRNCVINNSTVTPLHLSDHFFINLTVRLLDCPDNPPPLVSSYHNLKNLTSKQFWNMVSSSLPSTDTFSSLHPFTATDTLYSTLSVCLNSACPLTSRPSSKPRHPWLTNTICEARKALRSAERRWHKSHSMDDLRRFHELLTNFTDQITC